MNIYLHKNEYDCYGETEEERSSTFIREYNNF